MSPLRWMQSTDLHWRVILEEVTSEVLTEVGGADGAARNDMIQYFVYSPLAFPSPAFPVIPVTESLVALPTTLVAVTVIV